jgi:hypothetical protein
LVPQQVGHLRLGRGRGVGEAQEDAGLQLGHLNLEALAEGQPKGPRP